MHWTTHVITGAAWGYLIDRPAVAGGTCLVAHVLLDIAPHHDPDSDAAYVVDSLVGAAIIAYLAGSRRIRRMDARGSALWGAVGGALPDVELLVKVVKHMDDERFLFPTHNGTLLHAQTDKWISSVSQATLIAASLALVALKLRRETVRRCAESAAPGV